MSIATFLLAAKISGIIGVMLILPALAALRLASAGGAMPALAGLRPGGRKGA